MIGFKSEVRNKVIGFGSHIQITNLDAVNSYETHPIVAGDSLIAALSDYPEVSHVQRYSTKPGMIKTDDAFQGMVLKGVGPEFDSRFMKEYLVEGEIPVFSDSVSSNQVLISKALATKMKLKLGDKIYTYYIQDEVRARRLTIAGIYQTNFSEYDNLFLLTDLNLVNRLNGWQREQVSGVELQVRDYDKLEEFEDNGYYYDYPLIPDVDRNGNTSLAYQKTFGEGGSLESILELDFTDEDDGYKSNNMVPTFFYRYKDKVQAGTIAPSQVLVTEFTTASIFLPTSSTNTKTSDCRLYESIMADDVDNATSGTIAKYVYTNIPQIMLSGMSNIYSIYSRTQKNGANWIFYRTSDVMLMKAEALANMISSDNLESEMTEEDKARLKEAFNLVKAVNDRSNLTVGASSLVEGDYNSKSAMIDLVLEERRREFLFEGKRWFDLVRYSRREGNTQKLRDLVSQKFVDNASAATSKLTSMDAIYMPYNYDELRVNPNLHQNPAYGDGENSSYETTK